MNHHRDRSDTRACVHRGTTALTLAVLGLLAAAPAAARPQGPVARISIEAPAAETFTLEATLPVPPGEVLPSRTSSGLALVSRGQVVPTQVETVTRYADAGDGADVVELIARVQRPAGAAPGDELDFDVVRDTQTRGAFRPTPAVASLLGQQDALVVSARDLFGNQYTAELLHRQQVRHPSVQSVRAGRLVSEVRSHEVMLPTASAQTGARAPYPHLLGMHVLTRVYAEEDFVIVDVVFHNGISGRDASAADDPIHDVYFNQLDLHLPAGWLLGWAVDNPMVGSPVPSGAGTRVSLVRALPGGQFHYVPQQGQFVRRLVVAHGQEALARGRAVLERRTRGFCVPGPRPGAASANPADDLWSWWNAGTARFLTTNHRLPHLDHIPRTTLRAQLEARDAAFRTQTATGAEGSFPTAFGNLGWAHPWGVQFGGMTGGDEIEMYPCVDVAWARASVGLRWLDLFSKGYIDRQPVALFDLDGRPPVLDEHRAGSGANAYVPAFMYLRPTGSDDYFGFQGADQRFAEEAYVTARMPYYKKDIEDFQAIDLQHYTRFMNPLLGLLWLANDGVAKVELELSASLFQFSFHPYKNSQWGHVQGTGLRQRQDDVEANPGQGASFGRGEAWGIVASLAHYAAAGADERARMLPWYRQIVQAARQGQSTCSGNPTAIPIGRHFKGAYQSRQSFEVGFFLNAVEAIHNTALDGTSPGVAQQARQLLEAGAYSSTEAPFWNDTLRGQVSLIAVRPFANELPEFCGNIPENGYTQNYFVDHTTALPAWAYAFRRTQDGLFLQRATTALAGGGNAEAALESLGTWTLADFAPFLALLQEL